jgi:hypothetical protein
MALREIGDVGWFDACHSLIESYAHQELFGRLVLKVLSGTI